MESFRRCAGSTTLSDRIATPVMIDVLNRYFDCQLPRDNPEGGEVLEIMGDGLLAMFPIDCENETRKVCADALAARWMLGPKLL